MDRPALEELFAYTDWTWRQYEATIRPLGDDSLVKPVPGSGWPSLQDALAHVNWGYDRGSPTHPEPVISPSSP